MKTFKQIKKICGELGLKVGKLPNHDPSCPDVYPKYELSFEGTRAAEVLGQSTYLSGNMKGLNEDFEEVISLLKEPECTCQFNPSTDKKPDVILANEDCPIHN